MSSSIHLGLGTAAGYHAHPSAIIDHDPGLNGPEQGCTAATQISASCQLGQHGHHFFQLDEVGRESIPSMRARRAHVVIATRVSGNGVYAGQVGI
jgi:hypothetical protein